MENIKAERLVIVRNYRPEYKFKYIFLKDGQVIKIDADSRSKKFLC